MTRHLLTVKSLCASQGCTVVAAALPLDVQVDDGEWNKYRGTPIDMSPTRRLANDFIADAEANDVVAVDLFDNLQRVSPGAFLEILLVEPLADGHVGADFNGGPLLVQPLGASRDMGDLV